VFLSNKVHCTCSPGSNPMAACNVRRLFRRLAWEAAQGIRPTGSVAAVIAV